MKYLVNPPRRPLSLLGILPLSLQPWSIRIRAIESVIPYFDLPSARRESRRVERRLRKTRRFERWLFQTAIHRPIRILFHWHDQRPISFHRFAVAAFTIAILRTTWIVVFARNNATLELDLFADKTTGRVVRLIVLGLVAFISRSTKARIAGTCFRIGDRVTLRAGTSEQSARKMLVHDPGDVAQKFLVPSLKFSN